MSTQNIESAFPDVPNSMDIWGTNVTMPLKIHFLVRKGESDRNVESVGKEADLCLLARKLNLCDNYVDLRKMVLDLWWTLRTRVNSKKRVIGGQRAGELKMSTRNILSCLKYKRFARDCTHSSPQRRKQVQEW
ncbi:hypothetical protein PoB_003892700 [Plakobranchus ocellatus]|uniref:Uncharacterized protein n=1 Tax=Plakobranchus ocellatus TaxID=259542 RepID=A0AAV4AZW3_9GAST|nr:hypothetical protein PoB_003892700 [Plakobranchus ocellatus]